LYHGLLRHYFSTLNLPWMDDCRTSDFVISSSTLQQDQWVRNEASQGTFCFLKFRPNVYFLLKIGS
jgi:hypothetical protein